MIITDDRRTGGRQASVAGDPSPRRERNRAEPAGPAVGVPPLWTRRAAALIVLATIPSGLWRTSMALGLPVGADDGYRRAHYGFPGWGTAYVVGLTLLLVGLASLGLGLVRPWGLVVPRWIPVLGGRPVRPLAAVLPAALGSLALTLLWVVAFANLGIIFDEYGLEGAERWVVGACYAPLLLWGPLLAAITLSYARRTRAAGRTRAATG